MNLGRWAGGQVGRCAGGQVGRWAEGNLNVNSTHLLCSLTGAGLVRFSAGVLRLLVKPTP
ncbi:MAG TPA: hypothetical protein DCY88_04000 [Cyanobacteria bacterium UBA11372]|nr:hypothetical protein [Cyanobacteria bacterium UBA11372]